MPVIDDEVLYRPFTKCVSCSCIFELQTYFIIVIEQYKKKMHNSHFEVLPMWESMVLSKQSHGEGFTARRNMPGYVSKH